MLHSDCAVFLRIECIRVFFEVFFHAVAVCDTKLCREVYLADPAPDGLAYRIVRHAGSAVEHERDGYDLADLAQSVKIQFRDAFVDAVSCTDGNCQGGNACGGSV